MKKKILLAGLLCGTLFSPGWARPISPSVRIAQQEQSPAQIFASRLGEAIDKGDEKEIGRIIEAQPELARSTFEELLRNYGQFTPEQQVSIKLYLNGIAHYYARAGRSEFAESLKRMNLLLANAAPAAKGKQESGFYALYNQMIGLALKVGNFKAADRLVNNITELWRLAGPRLELTAEEKELVQSRFELLGSITAAFGGRPLNAISRFQAVLPRAAERPVAELTLRVLIMEAGRKASRPDLVEAQLGRARLLAAQSSEPSSSLYRFLTETFAVETELHKGVKVDRAGIAARYRTAAKSLMDYHVGPDSLLEGRLFWSAAQFWTRELSAHASWIDKDPGDDELMAACQDIASHGKRFCQESMALKGDEANVEYIIGLVEFLLDLVELSSTKSDPHEGRELLPQVDQALDSVLQTYRDLDKSIKNVMKRTIPALQVAFKKEGLGGVDFSPLNLSLVDGDLARLLARRDLVWIAQLRAESRLGGALDRKAVERRLSSAEAHQAEASRGQGYLGMDDARWMRLQSLTGERPPGWQPRVEKLLSQLIPLNNRLSYSPGQIMGLTYDGELKAAQNKRAEAIASLQKAVALAESYIVQVNGDANAAAQIRANYKKAYDTLARLQLEAGQGPEAFDTLSRLQQLNSVSQASSSLEKGSATISSLRNTNESLQQELTARKQTNQDTKPIEELLAQNKAEFHTVLNQIRRDNPRYESVLAIRPVNFSKQQKFIPANAAVVEYFPADDCLYIFVATTTDLKIHKVPVTSVALQRQVQTMRRIGISDFVRSIQNGAPAISWKDDSAKPLKDSLFALHKLLIDPVEADVEGKEVLAFIPTGYLDYLPFSALARPDAAKGAEFLIERKQCVTLLKSSDLDQLSRGATPGGGGVLALGNPDGSLPGSEKEVTAVTGSIAGSQKYLGEEARKERLSSLGPGISYLHLATHGMLDSRDPTASFLVMAGKEEQGKLRVPAIYDLKLDGVRLVTLSACQTALADREPGSELTSLADAFSVAGSNSVVASLWSVSDDSTRALMVDFYAHLKEGKSLAASLQQAEVSLLRNPATTHPFYWAPFTLIGDWR